MTHSAPIEADVATYIEHGDPADEAAFEALALRVFEHQYAHIEAVRKLADAAGRTPSTVARWQDIPAVPAAAFKHWELFCGAAIEQTFESSGTSGAQRSRSHFSGAGLELMDLAIRVNARRWLLPDGVERPTRLLVLAPAPELAPQMIMAWGMARLIEHFGAPGSRFFITEEGLAERALFAALRSVETPVCVIGASFGFVHLLDGLAERGVRFYCAPHSCTMDAGGFKGRSRILTRDAFDQAIEDRLEIPRERNVNLLGMTELASQFYDTVLVDGALSPRRKANAHWTRTRIIDPLTLQPAERGLIYHVDLANVERPVAVATDDIGVVVGGHWNILGRAAGTDAKGCSLTVAELLVRQREAAQRQPRAQPARKDP